jgi:hypothetical protein
LQSGLDCLRAKFRGKVLDTLRKKREAEMNFKSLSICCVVFLFVETSIAATCPQGPTPFVNCKEQVPGSTDLFLYFGYEFNNPLQTQTPITIPAGGTCNFFLPLNFRQGLIGLFNPGYFERSGKPIFVSHD